MADAMTAPEPHEEHHPESCAAVQLRTGIGTDVHQLTPGVPMHVAGLEFPDEPAGLAGHSDGDVAAHAMCDALLSAAGLADLGTVFGTSDPQWAGRAGVDFLRATVALLTEHGWRPVNVAVQVTGQRPHIAQRRAQAQEVLGAAVGAPVSVSATTTDHLGFTGAGQGVAAVATALIQGADLPRT